MDLVFLHGPPAVGKLTVARALAARTGLKLFHNHLVLDAVTAVFEFRSPGYVRLRESIWLDVFEAAAREGVSLVFTFVPETTLSPDFPWRVNRRVEAAGGRVRFVALICPIDNLDARIAAPSRAEFAKLRDVGQMRELREQGWLDYPMPPPELTVDTAALSPDEAAAAIQSELSL
jgi:hypothetical protein